MSARRRHDAQDSDRAVLVYRFQRPRGIEAQAVGSVERHEARLEGGGDRHRLRPVLGAEEPEDLLVAALQRIPRGELGQPRRES